MKRMILIAFLCLVPILSCATPYQDLEQKVDQHITKTAQQTIDLYNKTSTEYLEQLLRVKWLLKQINR
jgi:hypothetical protein